MTSKSEERKAVLRNERFLGLRDHNGKLVSEEERHYPVGNGWVPLVLELHEKLVAINPGYEIDQIKEKFGGLRYYVGPVGEEARKLIDEAEEKSFTICEVCGEPGVPRGGGWIKTLCNEHSKNEQKPLRRFVNPLRIIIGHPPRNK